MNSTKEMSGGSSSLFQIKTRKPADECSIQISAFSLTNADEEYTANALPQQLYEPTYRMQPNKKLTGGVMHELISTVMDENLAEEDGFLKQEYSAVNAGKFCTTITTLIKDRLIDLGYERYKCVVQVVCVPCMGQGLDLASRMVSDTRWDDYTTKEISPNPSMKLFIHAYSVYTE